MRYLLQPNHFVYLSPSLLSLIPLAARGVALPFVPLATLPVPSSIVSSTSVVYPFRISILSLYFVLRLKHSTFFVQNRSGYRSFVTIQSLRDIRPHPVTTFDHHFRLVLYYGFEPILRRYNLPFGGDCHSYH